MKISEILCNSLINTSLFEMAFNKKVAIDKARNLQNQISRHLVKIVMYSNSQYVNHWCSEVDSWLHDIQDNKVKGTNKPLQYRDLYNILFIEPLETESDVQSKMNRSFKEYPSLHIDETDARIVNKKLQWVLDAACTDIESSSFESITGYL